jgi:nucleoid DNA-binding protein
MPIRLKAAQMLKQIAKKSGVSPADVRRVLQAQAETIYENADRGAPVLGVGMVIVASAPDRKMTVVFGPHPGRSVTIPGKKSLKFRFAAPVREIIFSGASASPDMIDADVDGDDDEVEE